MKKLEDKKITIPVHNSNSCNSWAGIMLNVKECACTHYLQVIRIHLDTHICESRGEFFTHQLLWMYLCVYERLMNEAQRMYVCKLDLLANRHRQMSPTSPDKITATPVETSTINHVSVSKQNQHFSPCLCVLWCLICALDTSVLTIEGYTK